MCHACTRATQLCRRWLRWGSPPGPCTGHPPSLLLTGLLLLGSRAGQLPRASPRCPPGMKRGMPLPSTAPTAQCLEMPPWSRCPLPGSLVVSLQQQQLQAQHLSHAAHGPPVQLPPHPSGLQPPGIPPVTGSSSGLLALGALGSQAHLAVKDEKNHHDLDHRGESEEPGRCSPRGLPVAASLGARNALVQAWLCSHHPIPWGSGLQGVDLCL